MAGLTQKELSLLAEYDAPITLLLVPAKHNGEKWWSMLVQSEAFKGTREVQTARKTKKVWRLLDSVEIFITEIFPDREHTFAVQVEPKLRKNIKNLKNSKSAASSKNSVP